MATVLEILTRPSVLLVLAFFVLVTIQHYARRRVDLSKLPWVGTRPNERFTKLKAGWRAVVDPVALFNEGYEKYSRNGLPFVAPSLLEGPRIILPPDQLHNIMNWPETELGVKEEHENIMAASYTILDYEHMKDCVHEEVIKRSLTRRLGDLIEVIMTELATGFDEMWGTDEEEWKEVNIHETLIRVVARTTNRVLVGMPLCRNEEYLKNSFNFAIDVVLSGNLINQMPSVLKPIFGPIVTLPNKYHYRGCAKYTIPLIKERVKAMIERDQNGAEKGKDMPNDYIQWALEDAFTNPAHASEADATKQSYRIMIVTFAAIHTTTMTISHTLADLLGSPDADANMEAIRSEAQAVLDESDGVWTKLGLAKMLRTDSAIRESQRLHSILTSLARFVKKPGGVTLPAGTPGGEDIHLPQGARCAMPSYNIMRDGDNYDDSVATYKPFRFSSTREDFEKTGSKEVKDIMDHKNLSMVTTSDTHLPFGHGKHACPGRFFASNELKLLLAYLTLNYEIKPIEKHQEQREKDMFVFMNACAPDQKQTIWVRRRKGTASAPVGGANVDAVKEKVSAVNGKA